MAKRFSLSFAGSADSDLEGILAYSKEQTSPDTGRRLVEEIIAQTDRLPRYPDAGRVVPEFGLEQLHEIIYHPFRTVYRREKSFVL